MNKIPTKRLLGLYIKQAMGSPLTILKTNTIRLKP